MENLNASQVKKALECCIKNQCENCCQCGNWHEQWNCMTSLMKNALALINSQEQRIKELAAKVADLQDELKCEKETNAHLCSQYMSENHLRHQAEEMLANGMSVVKADTVRKIQERLKAVAFVESYSGGDCVFCDDIDQIAKEMLEGEE